MTQPWLNEKEVHVGFVHKITKDTIYVDFNEAFKKGYEQTDCNVDFQPQMGSIQMMHRGLDRAEQILGQKFIFPGTLELKAPLFDIEKENLSWFNKNLNEFQKNAVVNVLKSEARPCPYIVFGPPGTGKTSTLTELILQIMRYGSSKILVAAPSNSAADLLTKRLIQFGRLEPKELVRILAMSRSMESLDPFIENYALQLDEEKNPSDIPLGFHKITVGTCLSVGGLSDFIKNLEFSHIIIDEAGCASEPATLTPLSK